MKEPAPWYGTLTRPMEQGLARCRIGGEYREGAMASTRSLDAGRRPSFGHAATWAVALGISVGATITTVASEDGPAAETTPETAADGYEDVALAEGARALVSEPRFGDLDTMIGERLIRIAVPYRFPFFYLDGADPRGIHVEEVLYFTQQIEETIDTGPLPLNIVFAPTSREDLIAAVAEGRADIAVGNLTITEDRLALVDFGPPIYENVTEVVVTHSTMPPFAAALDLAGRDVHVRFASSHYQSLQDLNDTLASQDLEPARAIPLYENLPDQDLLALVDAGLIEITVMDSHIAALWEPHFENVVIHPEARLRQQGRIAWAFRKESPLLAEQVARYTETIQRGTLLGNILFQRYLEREDPLADVAGDEGMSRFRALEPHFRRYSAEYGIDWVLALAQGYHESRLDQSLRNRSGAIGVMQVLGATAQGLGISDIDQAENNIHAGIKFLRVLIDTVLTEDETDPLNQQLFAVASYNAGPRRIAQMRALAAEEGLDPDIWFDNVELVVARNVGHEPVNYVSNVFRSYTAYRLILDLAEARPIVRAPEPAAD